MSKTTATILSTPEVARAFGVSIMSVHNWRKGSARRTELAATVDATNKRVTFKVKDIEKWARKNDIALPAEGVVAAAAKAPVAAASKPGPKLAVKAKVTPAKPAAKKAPMAPIKAVKPAAKTVKPVPKSKA